MNIQSQNGFTGVRPITLLKKGLIGFKQAVHDVADLSRLSEGPEVIARVAYASASALVLIPSLTTPITPLKKFVRNVKDFINVLKGIRAVDGLVNFVNTSWIIITLNVTGTVLLIFTGLNLAEKFKWINIEWLHSLCRKVPILGTMPLAGLPHLTTAGFYLSLVLLALDKRKALLKRRKVINQKKIQELWGSPLNQVKIENQLNKYNQRILQFATAIERNQQQLAINTSKSLSKKIEKDQIALVEVKDKREQWQGLYDNFERLDQQELDRFQQAKLKKWKIKLYKLNHECVAYLISAIQKGICAFATILSSLVCILRIQAISATILITTLGVVEASLSLGNFFLKRSNSQIQTNPVKMKIYVTLS